MNSFYVSSFPGLGWAVRSELSEKLLVNECRQAQLRNAELTFFHTNASPFALKQLRTVEDVFVCLGRVSMTGGPQDLRDLRSSVWFGSELRRALGLWNEVRKTSSSRRSAFRVVVQADDALWRKYRRVDMQTAAEFGVMRFHRNMRLQPDEAPIEIWLQQSGHELIAGLRLNTAEDRQHGGRQVNRAAALRPSIAASMVRASGISDNDVFMDPMCGTGTLLLERAVMGRYELLLGGDSDRAAVNAAVANFGPRHKPRRIEVWDATALPIEVGSVDKVCTNLPWGRQIGNSFDLPELYRGVLRELARVVRPGGRIVIITSEWSLFKRIMREQPGLRLEATYSDIEVLGRRADIFQIVRA